MGPRGRDRVSRHALAMAGRTEEGIAQMRLGLSKWGSPGANALPILFASLGEMLAQHGNREEGLAAVADGLARTAQTGARMAEPELYRVKGELMMLERSDEDEAERCFRTASEIARGQGAMWWELRATVSLARLLKREGRAAEARKELAEIYGQFTEGFEFADLKDAKALLEELGS
jgi:hypothetical protein